MRTSCQKTVNFFLGRMTSWESVKRPRKSNYQLGESPRGIVKFFFQCALRCQWADHAPDAPFMTHHLALPCLTFVPLPLPLHFHLLPLSISIISDG